MTYLAKGRARRRRARHGFGVVMLLRAAPASGRGREGERLGAASAMAAALPIPLVEPVTSAVLPLDLSWRCLISLGPGRPGVLGRAKGDGAAWPRGPPQGQAHNERPR